MNARRGDIVLVAGGTYASKPRPVLLQQDSGAETGDSIVVIPFTRTRNDRVPYRVLVNPTPENGLKTECYLEVDKISAVRRTTVGGCIGTLEPDQLSQVNSLLGELLGLDIR
ncbi:MAG: type II toxin-antitoxin system PemK/MazF family toxin [Bifidobacteriaceae bacterium]|nr:type II toxin-antitoxin system PemK/MazF family toxin [Bifidobacteriaceae bacterium]